MEAEGWGGAPSPATATTPIRPSNNPDVTEKEEKRLDEIGKTRKRVEREARAALEAEEEAILARAILRTVARKTAQDPPCAPRLDSAGNLYFVRAVPMCGAVEGDAGE